MRNRILLLLTTALMLSVIVTPAARAATVENWNTNRASADFVGTGEGFDVAYVVLTETTNPGNREVVLHLEVCDIKTSEWPEPDGLEPECWHSRISQQTQDFDVNKLVFSANQIRFDGTVEMYCSYAWECGDEPSRPVHVELEWNVGDRSHELSSYEPVPGVVTVWRNTWTLNTSDARIEVSGLPFELEDFTPTRHSGMLEKMHVIYD